MAICSIGILTLLAEMFRRRRRILAGRVGSGKLRHRPRQRSSIGMLVRVIARPHQRTGLDMAETEAQCLVPQVDELFGLIEAGDRQMIF